MSENAISRLMQAEYPALYDRLVDVLESQHIHSYDVEARVLTVPGQDTVTLQLSYGDAFNKEEQLIATEEQIKSFDEPIVHFFREVAERCHEVMKLDYRDYMNPMGPRKSV